MTTTNPVIVQMAAERIPSTKSNTLGNLPYFLKYDAREGGHGRHSGAQSASPGISCPVEYMMVPSVIVQEESNVLINSRHPDATRILVTTLRKWHYDARYF